MGARILLIGHGEKGGSRTSLLLEQAGRVVAHAANGAEALALAREAPPDVAVTDLLMPVMDGFTLLRRWKADPQLKAIPLVVLTATYTDSQDEKLALELGADAFILKPVAPDAFLAQLDEVCARARQGRLSAAAPAATDEPVVLREYNEALVRRLELANLDLREREARLAASERRFRNLIEKSTDVVVLFDADGKTLFRSASGVRIFGYPDEAVLGHTFGEFVHPDDLPGITERFIRLLRTPGESFFAEFRYRRPDGQWGYADATMTNGLEDADIRAVVSNVREITERKKAETALRQTESTLRSIMESSSDAILLLDREAHVRFINRTAPGVKVEDVVGTSIYSHVAEAFRPAMRACFQQVMSTGEPGEYQTDYTTPSGARFIYEARVTAVRSGEQITGLAVVAREISDRKRVEAALRLSQEQLGTVFEHAMDGILIADVASKRFLLCNPAICAMLGYGRDELLTLDVGRIHPPEDLPRIARVFEMQALEERSLGSELPVLRKDGTVFCADINSFPITYNGRACLVGFFRDVSERKRAEAALEDSRLRYIGLFENSPVAMWLEDFSLVRARLAELGLMGRDEGAIGAFFAGNDAAFLDCIARVRILDVNRACLDMHAAGEKAELLAGLARILTDASRAALLLQLAAIAGGRTVVETETKVRTLDGRERDAHLRSVVLPGHEATFDRVLVTTEDITDRKQAEARIEHLSRLYATLSQVNQAIVRVKSRGELFPAVCLAAVEQGKFLRAWFALRDPAAGTLTIAAARGHGEERLVSTVINTRDAGFEPGLLAGALETGRLTIARDLAAESGSAVERARAERDGVRGAAVVPFRQAGEVAGLFVLESAEVDYFADPELQGLITEMAGDISFALDAMEADALRRRAEQAEAQARALADAAIRSLPGIFYLMTAEGRFVRWNKNFETVSGYTAEELARLHPTDLFTGEEKELIRQRIGIVFAEGESDAEAHFTSKDGTRTPYYFTGRRVLLNGRPHLVGMGVDLSARRQAEAALRQTREYLETILAHSPSGILVASAPDVTIRLANAAALGIRGGDARRLVHIDFAEHAARWKTFRPTGESYPPEELPLSRAVLRGETTQDEEVIIRDESGADHWVSANAAPIRDAQGRITDGVVVFHDITERKRAEKGLRDLAHAVNTAGDVVFLTDKEGVFTQINEQFTRLYGHTAEEVVGKATPRILKSGKQPPEFYQGAWATMLRGETIHGELVNRAKDGRLVQIEETITPFHDDRGELAGFLAVQREVGARKRAESESRLLQTIALGVGAAKDLDEALDFVLRQVCGTTGWAMGEVFVPNADRSRLECHPVWYSTAPGLEAFRHVSRDATFAPGEGLPGRVWRTKQPEWIPDLAAQGRLQRFAAAGQAGLNAGLGVPVIAHGEVVLVLDFFLFKPTDEDPRRMELIAATAAQIGSLIERKQAEAALADSEGHFRSLIANASDLVSVVDSRGVIRFQGPSIERLLGYTPGEVTNRAVFQWVHPDDAPQVAAAIRRVRANPVGTVSVEYRFRHKNGSWRTLESIGRSIVDSGGEPLIVVNSRDVTAGRQVEEQLRQSQKMDAIGHLAGGVAHDFNNILAAMILQAELLELKAKLSPEAREGLRNIRASADRAANLTRQLLLFSRKQFMQSRDLDVNESVASLAKMLQRIIGEDVRLELHLHPAPLWARADPGMLDQVLLNLAVNARDAMPQGGPLRIETAAHVVDEASARLHPGAAPGRHVCLRVTDTGCGIPPDVLPHIFEPFFTTKEPGKGTGLGLATVFGIVKQHRGWIEVRSEMERGSTFTVFLPAIEKIESPGVGQAARPPPRGGTETILLVEDDLAVRAVIQAILTRNGYRVLEANSGTEAMKLWSGTREPVALLLTDLVMPDGVSGHELARHLRVGRPGLKVIYISGYSSEIAGRELQLRADENFLQKPFSNDILLETVRRCLDG